MVVRRWLIAVSNTLCLLLLHRPPRTHDARQGFARLPQATLITQPVNGVTWQRKYNGHLAVTTSTPTSSYNTSNNIRREYLVSSE